MTKNVALSDEIIKELDKLKSENESYSQVIKKLLQYQPKTKAEQITEIFEPFEKNICKLITSEMLYPIELFRVICIKISNRHRYKDDINRFIEILEEYLKELK